MPNNPDDAAPLWDMLDAARAILDFISSKKAEDYYRDRMLRGAVERHLEIIFSRSKDSKVIPILTSENDYIFFAGLPPPALN